MTTKDITPWLFSDNENESTPLQIEYPKCVWDATLSDYLNDPSVRDLLHIPELV